MFVAAIADNEWAVMINEINRVRVNLYILRSKNFGLNSMASAGNPTKLTMKVVDTAMDTNMPKLINGGTSEVIKTPKPSEMAMKLNINARPVVG